MDNNAENLAARISLTTIDLPRDEAFLFEVYRGTREDLEHLEIEETLKHSLLQMQYQAQKQHYAAQFPNVAHDIILLDDQKIGRLMTTREADNLHIVDIALLPQFRRLGIGTILLRNLSIEAARTNRNISLQVWKTNPAARLYKRLGFVVESKTETHLQMQMSPIEK